MAPKKQTQTKKRIALKPVTGVAKIASFDALLARAAGKKMVLHIGCGRANPMKLHKTYQSDEWHEIRLDIDASVNPDITADMTDMSMIPDNAVHAVWSSHNIEHLYPHVVPVALKEIYRIIRPEGHFLATMPDIQTVATYVAHGGLEDPIYDSPSGPICPIDIMYGMRTSMAQGNLFMAHRTAFTAKTLGEHLRDAGFTAIRVTRDWVDLWAVGHKYPHGHPQRVERMLVDDLTEEAKAKMKMPTPLPVNRTPHPGAIAGRLTDELDIPPKIWTQITL